MPNGKSAGAGFAEGVSSTLDMFVKGKLAEKQENRRYKHELDLLEKRNAYEKSLRTDRKEWTPEEGIRVFEAATRMARDTQIENPQYLIDNYGGDPMMMVHALVNQARMLSSLPEIPFPGKPRETFEEILTRVRGAAADGLPGGQAARLAMNLTEAWTNKGNELTPQQVTSLNDVFTELYGNNYDYFYGAARAREMTDRELMYSLAESTDRVSRLEEDLKQFDQQMAKFDRTVPAAEVLGEVATPALGNPIAATALSVMTNRLLGRYGIEVPEKFQSIVTGDVGALAPGLIQGLRSWLAGGRDVMQQNLTQAQTEKAALESAMGAPEPTMASTTGVGFGAPAPASYASMAATGKVPVPEGEVTDMIRGAPADKLIEGFDKKYGGFVDASASANGIDPDLVKAISLWESVGKPDLVSSAGAVGLMQIKPATAQDMGFSGSEIQLKEPDDNIEYGTRYLKWLANRYPGDWDAVIQAYNIGPGAYDSGDRAPAYLAGVHHALRKIRQTREMRFASPVAPEPKSATKTETFLGGLKGTATTAPMPKFFTR